LKRGIILEKGYVSIILHTHLPFVRHPDKNNIIEERWLFEAMHESYIPLIEVYDNLLKDNLDFKITMSITPTMMEMLEDEYLNAGFLKYLNKLIELSEKELIRTENNKNLQLLANFYYERFKIQLKTYQSYESNLMNAFRKFDKLGCLEVLCGPATHSILPLFDTLPEIINAQLSVGIQSYIRHMGHVPFGMWLPECAYSNNLDEILSKQGIKYFISESKAVIHGSPRPQYGTYTPIATPAGCSVFPRDIESSRLVWSNITGYPGDFNYREFYRDIGYELPIEYIKPYINQNGVRVDTGIKYHKITNKTENKEIYIREAALNTAKVHGEHFSTLKNIQIESILPLMDSPPIIVCPYDTELFGHWWYEGPEFLDAFIRKSLEDGNSYDLITPHEYLKSNHILQCSSPSPSSWGANADNSMWLNNDTQWIYKDLYECQLTMLKLINSNINTTDIQIRMLNQAARELLLAEASDWPFIIKSNTTVAFAIKTILTHIENFNKLCNNIENTTPDHLAWLTNLESINNIFPDIDYKIYSSRTT
jgi:1,4-alpha-glucan branching enzyme